MAYPTSPRTPPINDPIHTNGFYVDHDNSQITPIAQLKTIHVGRLFEGDKEESSKLFQAVKDDGVFYLDLQSPQIQGIMDRVDEIFAFSKDLFSLNEEEKLEYDIDKLSRLKMNG